MLITISIVTGDDIRPTGGELVSVIMVMMTINDISDTWQKTMNGEIELYQAPLSSEGSWILCGECYG